MAIYNFTTPLSEKAVRELRVFDSVTLSGTIFGFRVGSMSRILDQKMDPPVSLQGAVCVLLPDPGIKKIGNRWEKICVGTSTSRPMERVAPILIEKYGVRAIIGRAGLSERSLEAMKQSGACYLAFPGGAAGLFTNSIAEVEAVHWEDLHPEGLYQFNVKDWEGFSVAMDSHGRNLYAEMKKQLEKKLPEIYRRLGIPA